MLQVRDTLSFIAILQYAPEVEPKLLIFIQEKIFALFHKHPFELLQMGDT